jgi:hypothetical protein
VLVTEVGGLAQLVGDRHRRVVHRGIQCDLHHGVLVSLGTIVGRYPSLLAQTGAAGIRFAATMINPAIEGPSQAPDLAITCRHRLPERSSAAFFVRWCRSGRLVARAAAAA